MSDPISALPAEPVQFGREYITEPGYIESLAKASIWRSILTPGRLIRTGVIFVIFALIVFGSILTSNVANPTAPIVIIALYFVFILLIGPISYRIAIRRLRVQIPVGSKYAVGFREEVFVLQSPLSTAEVAYRAYEKVGEYRGFVFLKLRMSRLNAVLPAELFTPESLDFLRSKVTGNQ